MSLCPFFTNFPLGALRFQRTETCPDDLRGLRFIVKIHGIKEVQETLQLHGQASEIWKITLHLSGYCSHNLSYGQTVFVCVSPTSLLPAPYFFLLSIFFSFCWFNKLWSLDSGYSLSCFHFSLLSFFLHLSLFPPPLKQPLWFEFSVYLLVVCVVKCALFKCMYFSSWASLVALAVKNLPANSGDLRDSSSIFGSEGSPVGGHGNPLQCSCLENPHGKRSLVGYNPWGHKELDMTERLSTAHRMNLYREAVQSKFYRY